MLALGFALMGVGLLLYLISVGSTVFGLQNSMLPRLLTFYFFGGIAFNVTGAYLVIKR